MNKNTVTEEDVALYLLNEIKTNGTVYQEDAVVNIKKKFDELFIYENENGNDAINKKVLREFDKLKKASEDEIEWHRRDKCWNFYKKKESSLAN